MRCQRGMPVPTTAISSGIPSRPPATPLFECRHCRGDIPAGSASALPVAMRMQEVAPLLRLEHQRRAALGVVVDADAVQALEAALVEDLAVARDGVVFAAGAAGLA